MHVKTSGEQRLKIYGKMKFKTGSELACQLLNSYIQSHFKCPFKRDEPKIERQKAQKIQLVHSRN